METSLAMEILQHAMPYMPTPKSLPGICPLSIEDWLIVDEVFTLQMAERNRLLDAKRASVLKLLPDGEDAAEELLQFVLEWLAKYGADYKIGDNHVARPDGIAVKIRREDPLDTVGRLVQEDFCLIEKRGKEHVLTGAVLCFPASWSLEEKMNRSLSVIHNPVPEYDEGIARRVQRLFDGVRVDKPIWRFNLLHYSDAGLFQPKGRTRENIERKEGKKYLRSERQCILRMPKTRACIFSIHTYVLGNPD